MGRIHELLAHMAEREASDIMIKVGSPPALRIHGAIHYDGAAPLADADLQVLLVEVLDAPRHRRFEETGQVETVVEVPGTGRFRGSIYRQRGFPTMVFRFVKRRIPTLEELRLPAETLQRLALKPRGLVLVTGVTGCGKSTTLAAMIQYVNETSGKHIVTIEDPIEYTFQDQKSVIDQREVGPDTESFGAALRHVLRQSPDIILIGEMRDQETMEAAIHAAETGHLVLSTLHTPNAMQAVDRIINMFEPRHHDFLRLQLSLLLEGVIAQRLLPRRDGQGRVPAVEVMTASPLVRELLLEGRTRDLYKAIKEGGYYGCLTFNQSLKALLDQDLIELEDAFAAADSVDELKLELRGISRDVDAGGQRFKGGAGARRMQP